VVEGEGHTLRAHAALLCARALSLRLVLHSHARRSSRLCVARVVLLCVRARVYVCVCVPPVLQAVCNDPDAKKKFLGGL
jgi:hypothetical protein